jgi:glycoside/pentoside/hexuronide:cation symporter, GPH family
MARKLSLGTKLGFGVCDLGGNLFFTAMGFWTLTYLTDTVLLPAALAGIAVMGGRVWDAVTDPMMGYISDRTRSRWGRRRPYLFFGAVPLFLTMWWFFTNPHLEGNKTLLTIWATFALCLLNTAYTIVNVPYSSLTPEMTNDYHERSNLNGFRFSFAVIGTMAGAGLVWPLVGLFSSKSQGFSVLGAVFGIVMAVTALITFFSVREPGHEKAERPTESFIKTYGAVFKNKPYLIVLFTYALNITALNFVMGIFVFYFKYIYNNEGAVAIAMILFLAIAMAFIPVSVMISKRIGKKKIYQISLSMIIIACMVIFFQGHLLGMNFFYGVMVFAGIGLGFGYVSPWAMLPDTIELDAVNTGKRKEGSFYGMWTFMSKMGTAFAIYFSGGILALAKYVPNAVQSPSAILAIRWLIGPIPSVIFLAAIILVQFYPLDEKAYAALLEEKAKKEAEAKKA